MGPLSQPTEGEVEVKRSYHVDHLRSGGGGGGCGGGGVAVEKTVAAERH